MGALYIHHVYHLIINYMADLLYTKFMSNGACNGTAFKGEPTSGIMRIIGRVVSFFSPGCDDDEAVWGWDAMGGHAYMCSEPWYNVCMLAFRIL